MAGAACGVVDSSAICLKKSQDMVVPAKSSGLTHLHNNWDGRLRGYNSDNQRGPEEQSHDSFYAPITATPSVK